MRASQCAISTPQYLPPGSPSIRPSTPRGSPAPAGNYRSRDCCQQTQLCTSLRLCWRFRVLQVIDDGGRSLLFVWDIFWCVVLCAFYEKEMKVAAAGGALALFATGWREATAEVCVACARLKIRRSSHTCCCCISFKRQHVVVCVGGSLFGSAQRVPPMACFSFLMWAEHSLTVTILFQV